MRQQITYIIVFLILLFSISVSFKWDREIIVSDGKGYYVYLPWLFLDNPPDESEIFLNKTENGVKTKYYCGTALLQTPFFLVGHVAAHIFNFETDGYSAPYHIAISVASIFYALLGLLSLHALLGCFGVENRISWLTIVLYLIGTNLLYYATIDGVFSHVYSFSIITFFLFVFKKWEATSKSYLIYVMAILLAIIFLIRPFNIIVVLFLPFLIMNKEGLNRFFASIIKQSSHFLLSIPLFIAILSIQFVAWYFTSGELTLESYSNEGFNFSNPRFFSVLFGFKKGLFVYTPLVLVSLLLFLLKYRKSPYKILSLIIPFVVLTWMLSSWWNWYYGDSFGLRSYIDFYSLFAVCLALALQRVKPMKSIIYILFGICIFLNISQSWQYFQGILHPNAMNFTKYIYALGKYDTSHAGTIAGCDDAPFYSNEKKVLMLESENDFEQPYHNWENENVSQSGSQSYELYNGNEFGAVLVLKNSNLPHRSRYYVRSKLKRKNFAENGSSEALFTASVINPETETNHYYLATALNPLPSKEVNSWKEINFNFNLLNVPEEFEIRITVWNKEKQIFAIDDFEIEIYGTE